MRRPHIGHFEYPESMGLLIYCVDKVKGEQGETHDEE